MVLYRTSTFNLGECIMKNPMLEEERFVLIKTEGANIFVRYASDVNLTNQIYKAVTSGDNEYDTDEEMVTEKLKELGMPFQILRVPCIEVY